MNDVGKQEHKEKKAAVILAAGSGRRMNTPVAKQFLDLMGIPVFLHSVRLHQMQSSIARIFWKRKNFAQRLL